jgi:hypothetical protein
MTQPSVLGNLATLGYSIGGGGSGTYTILQNVKSIGNPEPELPAINVSGLLDVVDIKTPGFTDNKQFTFSLFHTAANKIIVDVTVGLGVLAYWQITFSDGDGYEFLAFSKSVKSKLDRNAALVYDVTLEITGPIVPIA